MKREVIALLCLLLSVAVVISAAEKKEFKIPYEKYVPLNGMNVILQICR